MMSIRKISAEESRMLYSLLKSEQRPLDDIISDFNSKISRPHHFTFYSNIVWLLEMTMVEYDMFESLMDKTRRCSNPLSN